MWGWDPQPEWAQLLPPLMGAWSKKELGWAMVQNINGNVYHYLLRSCVSDVIWEIHHNMQEGAEYFLLELRYPCGFDVGMDHPLDWLKDRGGLAIWHIDETGGVDQSSGYPPPRNGQFPQHYRVAVVQGDGLFNLEQREKAHANKGDSSDLFLNLWGYRTDKAFKIDNSGTYMCDGIGFHPEPNTKKYSTGVELPTDITISLDWGYDIWVGITVVLGGAGDHRGAILP